MAQKNKQSKLVREQRQVQAELIELKKMRQGLTEPEKIEIAGEGVVQGSKWKNFWYYNWVKIVAILVIATVTTLCVVQCSKNKHPDLTIVLHCNANIPTNSVLLIQNEFQKYCEDYNGDGEVYVRVANCSYSADDAQTEEGNARATQLMAQFSNEEAIMYIVDEDYYQKLKDVVSNDFIDTSLNLPDKDGLAYEVTNTDFMYVFHSYSGVVDIIPEYTENNYFVFCRATDNGTIISDKKDVETHAERAHATLKKFMEAFPQKEAEE